jgi:hypothetical protein
VQRLNGWNDWKELGFCEQSGETLETKLSIYRRGVSETSGNKTEPHDASGFGLANRTLPAAISRRAVTMSRLSDTTSGLAPFKSCLVRVAAINTSSKRLETLSKQSSTVILAIVLHFRRHHRGAQVKSSQLKNNLERAVAHF